MGKELCKYHHKDGTEFVSNIKKAGFAEKRCPGCGMFYKDSGEAPYGIICGTGYDDKSAFDDDSGWYEPY